MLQKFKSSKWASLCLYASIFVFMLILNVITPIYADDYSYVYHFKTGKVIESIPEIFDSLKYHAQTCNGRLISHFFVHLFMMLPWIVFDVVNSLVFVLFIFLSYKIANVKRERDNFLALLIFLFTVLCHAAFGEEFLWVAGACNYMWAAVAGLLFLIPFHNYLVFDKKVHPALWVVFIPFGFVAGAYLENVSAAVVFTAALYTVVSKLYFKKKLRIEFILAIVASAAGYLFMITRPGTLLNKATSFGIIQMLLIFLTMLLMLVVLALPIVLYIQLFIKAKREGTEKTIIASSLILMAGAMASNAILIFAAFYPRRCAVGLATLVICAAAMLYNAVGGISFGKHTKKLCATFLAVLVVFFGVGLWDIILTRVQFDENEEIIAEAKAQGIYDVYVNPITPNTKYSGARGMTHLSKNPWDWPNSVIAKYYGIKYIRLKDTE